MVDAVTAMPLGELTKFADTIVDNDRETANYLFNRLKQRLDSTPPKA